MVVSPRGLRFWGRYFPCTVGRGGITSRKAEGDGATPRGTHRIVGMLYRPDRISAPARWGVPIGPGDLWCDDPTHEDYNLMVRRPFPASHEVLSRADPMYDLILLTDWNWPYAQKRKGSAIFMHQWRGPLRPTAGCIGLDRTHLRWIAGKISYDTRLIVL